MAPSLVRQSGKNLQERIFFALLLIGLTVLTGINYGHTAINMALTESISGALVSAVVLLCGMVLFARKRVVSVTLSDVFASGAVVYFTIHTCIWGSDNIAGGFLVVATYLYALILRSQLQRADTFYKISIYLTAAGAMEATLGIYQVVVGSKELISGHPPGTFNSPAIYACFLAITFIAALFVLSTPYYAAWKPVVKSWIAGILLTVMAIALVLSGSRAAGLSLIVALFIFVQKKLIVLQLPSLKSIRTAGMVSLTTIMLTFIWALIKVNPDSLRGRLLIWKITLQMVKEHPFTGVGVGNINFAYAKMQARYFSSTRSGYEQLLASLTQETYSEPLRLLACFGWVGFALVLISLVLVFSSGKDTSSIWTDTDMENMVNAQLCFIVCFSCFSFPFSNIVITLLAILFLSIKLKSNRQIFGFMINKPIALLLISITLITGLVNLERAYWMSKWRSISIARSSRPPQLNNTSDFTHYYSHLKWNSYFLYTYGIDLYNNGQYQYSLDVLEAAARKQPNADVFLYIGSCFEQLGDYGRAESTYLFAARMLPHHLMPKYRLLTLYEDCNQWVKAVFVAKEILGMNVKVPSKVTNQIKDYARSFLHKRSII
ncbi:O-antigen ligase family protein [Chitinophaga sp. S165]|uniref:O-antigen ligase family protein n=1 Tax=Chitinophaga sp. S165 TaxID=2135462 RepID=UPI000D709D08|nr:O-antigen ligase family protein [Chitinophaga sp. S165]PWV46211.1 O-antigen ligase-like membrane protein [Chitinophaga sp. S165]